MERQISIGGDLGKKQSIQLWIIKDHYFTGFMPKNRWIEYTNQILVSVGGDLGPAHIFNLTLSELVRC